MSEAFRGEFTQKVDGKARVSIPAAFRRVLEAGDPDAIAAFAAHLGKLPKDQLASFDRVIRCDEMTRNVIGFIKNVKLPWYARPIYRVLWLAAVASLDPKYRQLLQLPTPPGWVTPFTSWMLRAIRTTIGPESPIEDGALRRLQRLG